MTTKKDLAYGAKDSSTGAPIAGRYVAQGNAIVNSWTPSPTPTDVASTLLAPFAVGESPIYLSGNYQIPDPQAGVDNPSCVFCRSLAAVTSVTMPVHPYAGMQVTIKDADGQASLHNIQVQTSGSTTDLLENPFSLGAYLAAGVTTSLTSNGGSVTWRYVVTTSGTNQWSVVAKL